jgi:hypothetical protein
MKNIKEFDMEDREFIISKIASKVIRVNEQMGQFQLSVEERRKLLCQMDTLRVIMDAISGMQRMPGLQIELKYLTPNQTWSSSAFDSHSLIVGLHYLSPVVSGI